MNKKYCNFCNKWVEFDRHVEWMSHRRLCSPYTNKKISESVRKYCNKVNPISAYVLKCIRCGNIYVLELTKKKYEKGKYRKHCSYQCSNSRVQTPEMNESRRKKIAIKKICPVCKNIHRRARTKFCSNICKSKYDEIRKIEKVRLRSIQIQYKNEITNYRWRCTFRFDITNYPDKFDLSLIDKYGWYTSHGDNRNVSGISRDHMVSVKYGYEHDIDPNVLSHPANCKLMTHSKNSSKSSDNLMNIGELLTKIKLWDSEYSSGDVV